ncbi:MAG: hypothetical protein RI893_1547 [Pseudomonadota bacterium]|jgi:DamX protein
MVEDDNHWINQLPTDQITMTKENTTIHSLISKERTQKLDLLIHLLSNLPQSLVVCGPVGIGKTTLLNLLLQRNTESARYCLLNANTYLSFESIQQKLAETLTGKGDLPKTLEQYKVQHKQAILVIDNAGELVPGLISAIIQYAAENSTLRVVFALTHDELQVKRSSDKTIDDCHIVEIPTLSEKQCGDFLQNLSIKPGVNLPFKTITETMIAHVYRETHGVPGRIIAELPRLPIAKQDRKMKSMLVYIITAAIAIAFGVQWLVLNKNMIEPSSVQQKSETINIAPQKLESQIILTLPPAQQSVLTENTSASSVEKNVLAEPISVDQTNQKSDDTQTKITERFLAKPEESTASSVEKNVLAEPINVDQTNQTSEEATVSSANNFTLQLMMLSKSASVDDIIEKHPEISSGIRIIKTIVYGREKFILEYGSYPDALSAKKARLSLPGKFRRAIVKKIR